MVVDHTYNKLNNDSIPLMPIEIIHFDHVLKNINMNILLAYLAFRPVKILKVDLSDSFYRVHLVSGDAPKFGLAFLRLSSQEEFVAIYLVLTMR